MCITLISTKGMIMQLTQHARQRAAQRLVPVAVIQAIYAYGESYSSRGCTGLRLSREALTLAADDLPPSEIERLRRFHGTYLITSGAKVLTVAHAQFRRFN
jgi:hypothetical protein